MTTKTAAAVVLDARGVHYSDKKEEAYFTATFTLPRVGELSATFIADRYVARSFNGAGDDVWTSWRILRQSYDTPKGFGPKAAEQASELVEPVITAWLASDAYKAAREKAIAEYVIRTITDSRYGLAPGKRAFEQMVSRSELSFYDQTRIAQAIDHLEAAAALFEDEVRANG